MIFCNDVLCPEIIYISFGVDSTNSNIGVVMKFVKPLFMLLYKYYNIPYAGS